MESPFCGPAFFNVRPHSMGENRFLLLLLESCSWVSEIFKNRRRKFLKQMCCEEIWCRKGFEGSNCRPRKTVFLFYFIIILYYFIILLFFER